MAIELDLHGVRHFAAEQLVEDFILTNNTPYNIITGNSTMMKRIVDELLQKHDLHGFHSNPNNTGCITVVDKM